MVPTDGKIAERRPGMTIYIKVGREAIFLMKSNSFPNFFSHVYNNGQYSQQV